MLFCVALQAAGGSEEQQRQRHSSDDTDTEGDLLPPGQVKGKGYDWHKRTRQGKEYEIWFTDHDQLTEVGCVKAWLRKTVDTSRFGLCGSGSDRARAMTGTSARDRAKSMR